MAATVSVTGQFEAPGGGRLIWGTATIGVYTTNGVTMDISAYLSGSPLVTLTPEDGYVINHDRGTAAAGVLVVRVSNSSANAALPEAANATNLANVVCNFIAVGAVA